MLRATAKNGINPNDQLWFLWTPNDPLWFLWTPNLIMRDGYHRGNARKWGPALRSENGGKIDKFDRICNLAVTQILDIPIYPQKPARYLSITQLAITLLPTATSMGANLLNSCTHIDHSHKKHHTPHWPSKTLPNETKESPQNPCSWEKTFWSKQKRVTTKPMLIGKNILK